MAGGLTIAIFSDVMSQLPPSDGSIFVPSRSVVLVGLMGSGKTSLGRRLAQRLGLPFADSDHEVEAAAGCSVREIFERDGEAAFRTAERGVIERLLTDGQKRVLATGGGAFIQEACRKVILEYGLGVWLKANLDTLVSRTARRKTRPLLNQGNPREILAKLMKEREPVYALAPLRILVDDRPPEQTVDRLVASLRHYEEDEA